MTAKQAGHAEPQDNYGDESPSIVAESAGTQAESELIEDSFGFRKAAAKVKEFPQTPGRLPNEG